MAKFDFTPEQRAAIYTDQGPILVSAGAGSGKTRVLVQRLLRKLTEGAEITDFLIITYTKAAAAELRTRIGQGIDGLLREQPDNGALRRQKRLLHSASIGTIHSFCIGLIRENVHLLGVSPDMRVMDENEAAVLIDNVMDSIIEERYEKIEEDTDFRALVDDVSAGRDDRKLIEIVRETYEKLQSHPYPQDWMMEQLSELRSLDSCGDAGETVWGGVILSRAERTARYWRRRMADMLDEAAVHEDFIKAYGDSIGATVHSLDLFIEGCERGWDGAAERSKIEFPRAKNVKGYDEYKNLRNRCKKELEKLNKLFLGRSSELMEGMENVKPVIAGLFSVLGEFMERYGEEKRSRGLIDFSDQEHMAVRLLTDRDTLEPTELAQSVSKRYREIMVDEYQDVNAVQELIFQAVSRQGRNIFMVGDVKQSIYRFRLADPSIFMEKYNTYSVEPTEGQGRKILLTKNFRSDKPVLDCVNFVFANIMSTEFGEMDYGEDEYLKWGGTTAELPLGAIELDVIDGDPEDEEEDSAPDKEDIEAEFVAKRVLELSKTYKYGDICILLRSVKGRTGRYVRALESLGIPVYADGSDGFFDRPEIVIMLSMLSVIDNPRQDVPLISVLRSPIYSFTPDELAEIRLLDREGDFYDALVKSAETMEKSRRFLDSLEGFRDQAAELTTDRLIWHIYESTGFMALSSAMRNGVAAAENLMCLFDYAKSYESAGYKGLFSFVNYLRKQIEKGNEPPRASTADEDAVKIMSVHKSKGLEFPVVILSGLSKKFNVQDTQKTMLIHPKLGPGPKLIEPALRIEYDTLARKAAATVIREETLAEEMRVLYVAMTRAKEKLIMTCAVKEPEKRMAKLLPDASLPLEPQVSASAGSMADWILLTALNRAEAEPIRFGGQVTPFEDGYRWSIRLITDGSGETQTAESASEQTQAPQKSRNIAEKLSWRYPYSVENIPSKLTATELKGRFVDYEAAEEAEPIEQTVMPIIVREPDFIQREKRELTAAQKGTALHLAMQYIDYKKCGTIDEINGELDRLLSLGLLDAKQRRAVRPEKIHRFFASELGKRVLSAEKMYREFKFSILVPAETWYPNSGGDEILLQGVVDCCIVEQGKLTIIDYKTDYIDDTNLESKAESYAGQLAAYALAMERITGLETRQKALYFFSRDLAIII